MPLRAISRGGTPRELLARQHDATGLCADDADDRLQQRRLAGAVAAEQRDDLALVHRERRFLDDVALAVERVDAFDVEQQRRSRALGVAARLRGERGRARPDVHLAHRRAVARLGRACRRPERGPRSSR